MKKINNFLWFLLPLFFSSCLQVGYETLILNEINIMDEVIPVEYRLLLEQAMPIYNGNTPPFIEGTYLVSKHELVNSSLAADSPGDIYVDKTIQFSNQDNQKNILSYSGKELDISFESSDSVYIIGAGNDFTIYFISIGESKGIYNKKASIISGTITDSGIQNYYFAFVMLEKGPDPEGKLVEEGTYRIFKDSDGLAENSYWNKSTIINIMNLPLSLEVPTASLKNK